MALSLNKPKLDNLASDIWKSAQRLRGKFKSDEYQSVILPIAEFDTAAAETLEAHRAPLGSIFATEDFARFEKHVQDYVFGEAQAQLEQALKRLPGLPPVQPQFQT